MNYTWIFKYIDYLLGYYRIKWFVYLVIPTLLTLYLILYYVNYRIEYSNYQLLIKSEINKNYRLHNPPTKPVKPEVVHIDKVTNVTSPKGDKMTNIGNYRVDLKPICK